MKDFKLGDKSVKIREMSVDDIDFCNDVPQMRYEGDEVVAITNLSKARTAWIRKGVDGCDDKFIKSSLEFFPEIKNAKYVGSMFTIRAVPPRVEDTDERPTLVKKINEKVIIHIINNFFFISTRTL